MGFTKSKRVMENREKKMEEIGFEVIRCTNDPRSKEWVKVKVPHKNSSEVRIKAEGQMTSYR